MSLRFTIWESLFLISIHPSRSNLDKLTPSGKVAGIVLVPDSVKPSVHSPDSSIFPSLLGPLSSNFTSVAWNPNGLSLLQNMYTFPIFEISSLNASATASLLSALQYNAKAGYSTFPLYSMEMQANMWSGSTSPSTCLRRGYCSPIGGLSVWSTPSLNMQAQDTKPVILVISRIDANALVHDLAVGASHRATAAVLLGIADALSKSSSSQNLFASKTVVFALFDAENWGAAGSARFVQDISATTFQCLASSHSSCPFKSPACGNPCMQELDFRKINFNNIASIIEFDVGGLLYSSNSSASSPITNLYMHIDQQSPQVTALLSSFASTAQSISATNTSFTPAFLGSGSNNGLPPSSAMSFLAKKNIPTVLIADYKTQFSNPFYNSEYDDGIGWGDDQITQLCRVSNAASKSIASLLVGEGSNNSSSISSSVTANCSKIFQYVDCMTRNFSCSLMQSYVPLHHNLPLRAGSYSSTFSFSSRLSVSYLVFFLHRTMFSIHGNSSVSANGGFATCTTDADCPAGQLQLCLSSKCTSSLTRFHDAYGTGLEMDYATGSFKVTNLSSRSSWVESTWDSTRVRIYLQPGTLVQGLELGVSLVVNLAVFLALYYSHRSI